MASQTTATTSPVTAQSDFTVPFPYLNPDHVVVTVYTTSLEAGGIVKSLGADYSFSSLGVIHFNIPVTAFAVVIERITPDAALITRFSAGTLSATLLNLGLTQLLNLIQETSGKVTSFVSRAVRAPVGEALTQLPGKDTRAGRVMAFDTLGNPSTPFTVAELAYAILESGAGGGGPVALASQVRYTASPTAIQRNLDQLIKDGAVFVNDYGAKGDGVDDTAAIEKASLYATSVGRPLLFGAGLYYSSKEIKITHGVIGMGRGTTRIGVLPGSGTWQTGGSCRNGEKALLVVNPLTAQAPIPIYGFALLGNSIRPALRSSNPASIVNIPTGILFAGNAYAIHLYEVTIQFFYKGLHYYTQNGHFGSTGCKVSNCWYNVYVDINSGDFRFFDCDLSGAILSTYGCHGTNYGGTDNGGISGLVSLGTHGGFSPYYMFQEPGNGTVGFLSITLIHSPCEQIGNAVVFTKASTTAGQQRNHNAWEVISGGHSWTIPGSAEHNAFAIQGDANFPVQTYAVTEIQLHQGGVFAQRQFGWLAGSSGYMMRVLNNLDVIEDYRGSSLYEIVTQGQERVVGVGRKHEDAVDMGAVTASGGSAILASFNIPPSVDGQGFGRLALNLPYNNPDGAMNAQVRFDVNGVEVAGTQRFLKLEAGDHIATPVFDIPVGRRDRTANVHTLRVRVINAGNTQFNQLGLPGRAYVTIGNPGTPGV